MPVNEVDVLVDENAPAPESFQVCPLPVDIFGQDGCRMVQTLDSITDAFFTVDNNWRVTYWNHAAEEMFGGKRQNILGNHIWEMYPEGVSSEYYPQMISAMEDKNPLIFSLQGIIDKGKWFSVRVYPSASGLTVFAQDITEHKHLTAELSRLEQLNVVGHMAAAIGHEIRNPMTVVRGFLQLMSQKEKYLDDKNSLLLMIDELDRANSIITSFLSMASDRAIYPVPSDLNDVIKNLLPEIQADAIQGEITVSFVSEKLPPVLLDHKEMRQLVLNLTSNACESMDPGGLLTLRTSVDNDQVVLEIRDQGKGIPSEILENIGTPFQSTKEQRPGMGLGVCYSIVNRMKAKMEIDTGSEGTTVRVIFPANGVVLDP